MTSLEPHLILHEDSVEVCDESIKIPGGVDVAKRLRALLGPIISTYSFANTGRTAQALKSGIILLVQDRDDELLAFSVCFDPKDFIPYPALSETAIFSGYVECGEQRFSGGESEPEILRVPGVTGFAGVYTMDVGALHVGLRFQKRRNKFGKRTGQRRLVLLDAGWGGVKPFPTPPHSGGAPGASAGGRKP